MSLFEEFSKKVRDSERIGETAAKAVASKRRYSPDEIRRNFSGLIQDIEKEAYRIYLGQESTAGEQILQDFIKSQSGKPLFRDLNAFFLSIAQSRKARAGKTFEATIHGLFKQCGYPFEEQCVINGKPDFLMPSEEHYRRNAPDCIIFTVKRTLRERWRQIATEGVRGKGLFLATIDAAVSANNAKEMLANRIYLVVPAGLKEATETYRDAPNIISFEDFFTDHLDPAMARWKRAKII